jgi:EmrB/QacA subfamily drug resistance transporter
MKTTEDKNQFQAKYKFQIIIIVAFGTFMSALDASIVNIALPVMSKYYNVSLTTVEWVILSYLITITSLLLTFGKLGDLYGHKKIFNIGLIIFTLGSLFCALSPSIAILIAARLLQAVGAGMLMSMGPAIITINTPAKERGKSLGAIAVSVSIALILGPVIGGMLTSYFGWQSIFYINLPIGIATLIWAISILPVSKLPEKNPFDFTGAIILFLSLIAIISPLSFADKVGWKNPYIIFSLAAGAVLLAVFFIVEYKIKYPMLDLALFKNRLFTTANISLMLNFIAQYSITLIMPFYLIQLRGFEPSKAGLLLIAAPAVVLIIAPLAGFLADKTDTRFISSAGMLFSSAGLFLISTLKANTNIALMVFYYAIIGFGIGFFQTPNNSAIMGSVQPNCRGVASSMIATMRNLGMVLGVAISGSIFSARMGYLQKTLQLQSLSPEQIRVQSFTGALQTTFIVAGILSSIAIFMSLIRGPLKPLVESPEKAENKKCD